jgi:TetR/AcrR family transcriptional repressor of nem operon
MTMPKVTDTRERLLAATLQLLWDESLSAASVDAICEKAGVKKGSFYHFFETKADLVAAALDERFQCFRGELDRVFSASVPPVERLRQCVELMHQHQVEKRKQAGRVVGCPFASVGSSCSKEDGVIQEKVQELLATQLKYLESAIRDGQADGSIPVKDARGAAEAVHDYMEGALTAARIQNSLKPIENMGWGVFALLGLKWDSPAVASRRK